MRITVTLDDELLARAIALTGVKDRSALIDAALRSLIAREASSG